MAEELSVEQLYDLYLLFDRDFREANPETKGAYVLPSLEGFEFTLQRLSKHPGEKEKIIRQWKQGWTKTSQEIQERIEAAIEDAFANNLSGEETGRRISAIAEEGCSYLRYV